MGSRCGSICGSSGGSKPCMALDAAGSSAARGRSAALTGAPARRPRTPVPSASRWPSAAPPRRIRPSSTRNLLEDTPWLRTPAQGLPVRLQYRLEIWRSREAWLDDVVRQLEWTIVVRHEPLLDQFTVTRLGPYNAVCLPDGWARRGARSVRWESAYQFPVVPTRDWPVLLHGLLVGRDAVRFGPRQVRAGAPGRDRCRKQRRRGDCGAGPAAGAATRRTSDSQLLGAVGAVRGAVSARRQRGTYLVRCEPRAPARTAAAPSSASGP